MWLDSASLRMYRCVPVSPTPSPTHSQVDRKDVPMLYAARPYTVPFSVAGLLLSQFCCLCRFAEMLTLPNKPLCSSKLCCLTFDSPLLSVSATFAGQTKGPRKSPQPGLVRRRMRPAFHPGLQADGSLSLGQSFGKSSEPVVPLGSPSPCSF